MNRPAKPAIDRDDLGANYAAALAHLRERYAYLDSARGRGSAVPKHSRTFEPVAIASLRDEWMAYRMVEIGPKGGKTWHHPIDAWAALAERVGGAQCRPDMPTPTFTEPRDGKLYVNTWHPIELNGGRASLKLMFDFTTGLFPDHREHEHLIDQIACKMQHPEIPGVAPLMVAHNAHGTGRTTLFQIIADLVGPMYASWPSFHELLGRYNEHLMAQAVFVSETRGIAEDFRPTKLHEIMESLKQQIDTMPRDVVINMKFGLKVPSRTFSTFYLATNHLDALPIRKEDRRFNVYRNGAVREPALYARVHAMRRLPGFLPSLHRFLMSRDISRHNPYQCIQTEMREQMQEASTTEIESAVDQALTELPGVVLQVTQAMRAIEVILRDGHWAAPGQWAMISRRLLASRLVRARDGQGIKKVFARSLFEAVAWRDADPALVDRQLKLNEAKLAEMGAMRRLDVTTWQGVPDGDV